MSHGAATRLAKASDAAAVARIYHPVVAETPASFELVPPTAAEMRRRIAKAHLWLVYEKGGKVIGYAYASPHHDRAAYRRSVNVSVYIDESHRGRGIGRALYRELFARLKKKHFVNACAGITLPNKASVGLHESLGFRKVGVYRRIGFKLGRWRDVGWWQLALAR